MNIRQRLVCDLIVLRAHVQHAHWNFIGSEFMSIHPFLGNEVLSTVEDMLDWCAEDLRRDGEYVNASLEHAQSTSDLPKAPTGAPFTRNDLTFLGTNISQVCETVHAHLDYFNPSEQSSITAYTDKLLSYAEFWFRSTDV